MAELKIRPAQASDSAFILANVSRLLDFGPPAWRNREAMLATDTAVIEHSLLNRPPDTLILLAENAEGIPLGFIHLTGEFDYYSQREQTHVADLVVVKEGEGLGVGSALLRAGEAWARERGSDLLTLNVFVQNSRAQRLYERVGFEADTLRYIKQL